MFKRFISAIALSLPLMSIATFAATPSLDVQTPSPSDNPYKVSVQSVDEYDQKAVPRLRSTSLPSSYLPADQTAVKDQGTEGLCWAYSATKSMEASTYTNLALTKTYSPLQFARAFWNHNLDQFELTKGDYIVNNSKDNGSNDIYTVWASMKQITPNTQSNVMQSTIHPVEAQFIDITDSNAIKQAIMDNGAVTIAVQAMGDAGYWYHSTDGTDYNHAITLIGWSDAVQSSRFTEDGSPDNNGAWYFVNSWGTEKFGTNGYGWLSYEDPCFSDTENNRALTYIMDNTWSADNLYQQDGSMSYATAATTRVGNVFRLQGANTYEKVIGAIVGIKSRGNYTLSAYSVTDFSVPVTDSALLGTVNFSMDRAGYKTVYFDSNIIAEHGENIAIVITRKDGSEFSMFCDVASEAVSWIKFRPTSEANSYYWEQTQYSNADNATPRIKMLTENLTATDPTGTMDDYNISLDYSKCMYTGEAVYPTITITDLYGNKQGLENFKISYNNNINASSEAEVVIRSIRSDIVGTATAKYTIKPYPLDQVETDSPYTTKVNLTYQAFLQNLKLSYNKKVLTYGKDFTCDNPSDLIQYGDNSIHIKGIKNFNSGMDLTVVGTTNGTALKDLSITCVEKKTFTGKPVKIASTEIRVKHGTTTLQYGTDFRLTYKNNINAGTATVTLIGLGSYTGISGDVATFTIVPLNINSAVIQAPAEINYLNQDVKLYPGVNFFVYAPDGVTLIDSTNYSIDYTNNKQIGTMIAYVKGTKNLTGTVPLDIPIVEANLKNAVITVDDCVYTGSPCEPEVIVTLDGVALTKGVHYHTVYSNNTNAGTATVSVIGDGFIAGVKEKTFKITKPVITADMVSIKQENYYTGFPITPTPVVVYKGKQLALGKDFIAAYSNNLHVGTATVTISGINGFGGTATKTFNILKDTTPKFTDFSTTLKSTNAYVFPKNTYTLDPYFIPMSVKTSNKKLAKVKADNSIKIGKKEGSVQITATGVSVNNIVAYDLKIVKPKFKAKTITVNTKDSLYLPDILTMYNIDPSKIKVSKKAVCNFDEDTYKITFNKKGTARLTVYYGKYKTSVKFKVKDTTTSDTTK